MPIDIPKQLLDAGGWVFAAAEAVGIILLIVRGDLVPKPWHVREIERADRATDDLEKTAGATERLIGQVEALVDLLGRILRREDR